MNTRFTIRLTGTAPLDLYDRMCRVYLHYYDVAPSHLGEWFQCGPLRLDGPGGVEVHGDALSGERRLVIRGMAAGYCQSSPQGRRMSIIHVGQVACFAVDRGIVVDSMTIDFDRAGYSL